MRAVLLAAGLLVVAVTAALITLLVGADDTPSEAAGGNGATETTSSTTTPTTTTTVESTTTTDEQVTTTTPPPQPPQAEQPQPNVPAATPDAAIADYYALMPGNLDVGWTRLTAKFQAYPALGRDGYERFWSDISSVEASQIAQTSANVVEVTLLYTFKDGHTERERHRYTLVNQNGAWLIDSVVRLNNAPA